VEVEFDESILHRHIAMDLCFHSDDGDDPAKIAQYVEICRAISNYMLFLLVARPFMLTAGIGQIRFGDTCAKAKNFFERAEMSRPENYRHGKVLGYPQEERPFLFNLA
jgi:hypothetical protein